MTDWKIAIFIIFYLVSISVVEIGINGVVQDTSSLENISNYSNMNVSQIQSGDSDSGFSLWKAVTFKFTNPQYLLFTIVFQIIPFTYLLGLLLYRLLRSGAG